MGTDIVVVAIPRQDDYVWKISSEKVPHMTILNLGSNVSSSKLEPIVQYLEHATNTMLERFGMSVKRRDVLGPNQADVLLFEKDHPKRLHAFRSALLKSDSVLSLYNATPQFPEWTPHVTLGYPEFPAHEDTREHPGINWIEFDRIALWTGNYDGPTFNLDDDEDALAMSNVTRQFLEHHGVKGMKWGVRKNYEALRSKPREHAEFKSKNGETVSLDEKPIGVVSAGIGSVSKRFRKMLTEGRAFKISVDGKHVGDTWLREKSKDEVNFGWLGVKPKERGKGYATTIFNAGVDYASSKGYSKISLEVPGNAPDARHIYEKAGFKSTGVFIGSKTDIWGGLEVMEYQIPKKSVAKHSDSVDPLEFERALEQTFNDPSMDRYVWGEEVIHKEVLDDVLAHYGVKGMKWGVRRSRPEKPGASEDALRIKEHKSRVKRGGVDSLSTKELQDLVNRMNLEQQYSRLSPGTPSEMAIKFVSDLLLNVGKQQASRYANDRLGKILAGKK